jgi:hypothetical protein
VVHCPLHLKGGLGLLIKGPRLIQIFKANNLSNLPIGKGAGVTFQIPVFTMEEKIQTCLLGNVFIMAKIITFLKIVED